MDIMGLDIMIKCLLKVMNEVDVYICIYMYIYVKSACVLFVFSEFLRDV